MRIQWLQLMRLSATRFLLGLAMLAQTYSPTSAQPAPCTYVFGFAALHALLPDEVGTCVADETHDAASGDALQQTSNGLLVWRKADNWTAFTDGSQSWINGPLGLEQRSNDQRLWWEANPDGLAIVPPPQAGERCHTAGLSLSVVSVDAGAGNLVGTFAFTNTLDTDCTMFGYPGAQLLDTAYDPLPTSVARGGGVFATNAPPTSIDVPAHGTAIVRIHWEQVPVGNETTCSMASNLAVTPPDEYVGLQVPISIRACGGGHLDVSAAQLPLT